MVFVVVVVSSDWFVLTGFSSRVGSANSSRRKG